MCSSRRMRRRCAGGVARSTSRSGSTTTVVRMGSSACVVRLAKVRDDSLLRKLGARQFRLPPKQRLIQRFPNLSLRERPRRSTECRNIDPETESMIRAHACANDRARPETKPEKRPRCTTRVAGVRAGARLTRRPLPRQGPLSPVHPSFDRERDSGSLLRRATR